MVILFVVPFFFVLKKGKDNGVIRMQLLPCPLLHGYPSQSVITIFQVNISIYFHCHWICEEHTLLQARRPSEVWLFGRQWFILSTPLSLVLLLTLTQTVRQHCNHFTSWFCLNWNSFSPNYWWCFPKLYRRISGYSKSAFISLKVCFCYTQVGKKKICSRIPKFSICFLPCPLQMRHFWG